MSHMVLVDSVVVTSIPMLEKACQELGLSLYMNTHRARYYGGKTQECAGVVRVPGVDWDIALIPTQKGRGDKYMLAGDFFGETGEKIEEAMAKLTQKYVELEAIDLYTRQMPNTSIVNKTVSPDGTITLEVAVGGA